LYTIDLRKTKLPWYNPGIKPNESVENNNNIQTASDTVKWAVALIFAFPDYHGSMSYTMKNFLDYFWEKFAGKTFGYLCTSHGKGLTAIDQRHTAVRLCLDRVCLPYSVSINGEQDFNVKGEITKCNIIEAFDNACA
jgi:NAD(P)H-dependent FMN reductase